MPMESFSWRKLLVAVAMVSSESHVETLHYKFKTLPRIVRRLKPTAYP
jgi:hypothetical protein